MNIRSNGAKETITMTPTIKSSTACNSISNIYKSCTCPDDVICWTGYKRHNVQNARISFGSTGLKKFDCHCLISTLTLSTAGSFCIGPPPDLAQIGVSGDRGCVIFKISFIVSKIMQPRPPLTPL